MATVTTPKKDARIDLRMSSEQKEEIELAASLSGISLSQWSMENLLASAREVIARSGHTVMSPEDFDAFSEALDRPMNAELESFVSQRSIWER